MNEDDRSLLVMIAVLQWFIVLPLWYFIILMTILWHK